jgi:hypothetical protein
MTRDDIIKMAKQAKLPYEYDTGRLLHLKNLERFAALVAAHEREACAKLCDEKVDAEYAQEPVECMCGICKLGKREWVGLTDEEADEYWDESVSTGCRLSFGMGVDYANKALKEKNT